MASNFPPVKNAAFTLYFFVYKTDGTVIANPTLASSAVHVDGNTTEITNSTLAVVDATTGLCSIVLAQATMNGDQIDGKVVASDTGAIPYSFKLLTAAQTLDTVTSYIDTEVAAIKAKTDTLGGPGATEWTYTLTEAGGTAIADATVWVTSDVGGSTIVATGTTNTSGVVTFYLDSGTTYYIWASKSGYTFDNPDTEVVS